MKENSSLLEIFQDPLLTIIALALLTTVGIIIPSGTESPQVKMDPLEIQGETDRLKRDLASINKRIKELELEIDRINEYIHRLEGQLKESEKSEKQGKSIDELAQRINELKTLTKSKMDELAKLEKELKTAREKFSGAKKIEEIDREIKKIREEIRQKEAILKALEEKLNALKEKNTEKEKEKEGQGENIQEQIKAKEEEIESLKKEHEDIKRIIQGEGFGEYSEAKVRDKKPVWIEAVGNRVVVVNVENYDVDAYKKVISGNVVTVYQLSKKRSVNGESGNELSSPSSSFQGELSKLNPQKEYIVFLVNNDSYKVFREARAIAFKRKFVVGWTPQEGKLYFTSGGGGGSIVPGR